MPNHFSIFSNFRQIGTSNPTVLKAFGDEFGSLGFSGENPDYNIRVSKGVYQIYTGDELISSDNIGKVIHISFSDSSNVAFSHVSVIDTMKIELRTFDFNGDPLDIDGEFSISLTLNVE